MDMSAMIPFRPRINLISDDVHDELTMSDPSSIIQRISDVTDAYMSWRDSLSSLQAPSAHSTLSLARTMMSFAFSLLLVLRIPSMPSPVPLRLGKLQDALPLQNWLKRSAARDFLQALQGPEQLPNSLPQSDNPWNPDGGQPPVAGSGL